MSPPPAEGAVATAPKTEVVKPVGNAEKPQNPAISIAQKAAEDNKDRWASIEPDKLISDFAANREPPIGEVLQAATDQAKAAGLPNPGEVGLMGVASSGQDASGLDAYGKVRPEAAAPIVSSQPPVESRTTVPVQVDVQPNIGMGTERTVAALEVKPPVIAESDESVTPEIAAQPVVQAEVGATAPADTAEPTAPVVKRKGTGASRRPRAKKPIITPDSAVASGGPTVEQVAGVDKAPAQEPAGEGDGLPPAENLVDQETVDRLDNQYNSARTIGLMAIRVSSDRVNSGTTPPLVDFGRPTTLNMQSELAILKGDDMKDATEHATPEDVERAIASSLRVSAEAARQVNEFPHQRNRAKDNTQSLYNLEASLRAGQELFRMQSEQNPQLAVAAIRSVLGEAGNTMSDADVLAQGKELFGKASKRVHGRNQALRAYVGTNNQQRDNPEISFLLKGHLDALQGEKPLVQEENSEPQSVVESIDLSASSVAATPLVEVPADAIEPEPSTEPEVVASSVVEVTAPASVVPEPQVAAPTRRQRKAQAVPAPDNTMDASQTVPAAPDTGPKRPAAKRPSRARVAQGEPTPTNVDQEAVVAEQKRAYEEITKDLKLHVDADTNVEELVGKLSSEKGWQDDETTRAYVEGAKKFAGEHAEEIKADRQQESYEELSFLLGRDVDPATNVDAVLDTLVRENGWQKDDLSKLRIQDAIEYAKAHPRNPDQQHGPPSQDVIDVAIALAERQRNAYAEITDPNGPNIPITGETNAEELLATLVRERGWQDDDTTRAYVDGAVDYARANPPVSENVAENINGEGTNSPAESTTTASAEHVAATTAETPAATTEAANQQLEAYRTETAAQIDSLKRQVASLSGVQREKKWEWWQYVLNVIGAEALEAMAAVGQVAQGEMGMAQG